MKESKTNALLEILLTSRWLVQWTFQDQRAGLRLLLQWEESAWVLEFNYMHFMIILYTYYAVRNFINKLQFMVLAYFPVRVQGERYKETEGNPLSLSWWG
jgi:hypothetical protein